MASSQRRRVFVGNIPYGATEEQLLEICQEVGPVLSFRLVVDRETGKRKGYGFCEYRDEETALSARRNLQGYEIKGRQLRVDFAENDKGADRKREQSRGGPGMAPNVDPQKKLANTAIHGESVHHHPIGLHTGITAAAAMAGALGGVQAGMQSDQNGLHSQPALANDPLTLHLAKMSRSQLNEIMSELKAMTTQNKEQAHQLLLSIPQLPKALFQAQIMLGMVTPEVMENVRQPPLRDSLLGQPPAVQTLAGLPPFAQNKMQSGMVPKVPENHSAVPQNPLVPNQFSSPQKPRIQLPQHGNNHILQPATVPGQSGVSQIQGAGSSSVNHKMQPHLLQHSGQAGPSIISGISPVINKDAEYRNAPPGSMHQGSLEPVNRPAKLMKLNDGRSHASGSLPVNLVPKAEAQYAEKQTSQSQFPPEVESVLLQQVLNLTLEQLSSLPPEEQQQVIKLQQSLRRDQILVS